MSERRLWPVRRAALSKKTTWPEAPVGLERAKRLRRPVLIRQKIDLCSFTVERWYRHPDGSLTIER